MEKLPDELQEAVKFHGHLCPGVVLGYRVAILARKKMGLKRSPDEELVVIVENDTCAVDAIQFINGATFGKGNLIFKDHGIPAYTFIERISGKQIRIELKADVFGDDEANWKELSKEKRIQKMLSISDEQMFDVKDVNIKVPEKARIFNSIICSKCGLSVMETRARLLNDKLYCIPCWKSELKEN
jgi:formylmethanofuran dehydrogenase subunit E